MLQVVRRADIERRAEERREESEVRSVLNELVRRVVGGEDEDTFNARQMGLLTDYVLFCGGKAQSLDGWTSYREFRQGGATAGTFDIYYLHATGDCYVIDM